MPRPISIRSEHDPAHGIKRPKGNVRDRRLSEAEYHALGEILREAEKDDAFRITVDIIRQIALTGCRRSEIIKRKWAERDLDGSCLRSPKPRKAPPLPRVLLLATLGYFAADTSGSHTALPVRNRSFALVKKA